MEKTILHYRKKTKLASLIQGVVWLTLGFLMLYDSFNHSEDIRFFDYAFLLIGVVHLFDFFIIKRNGYLIINKNYILKREIIQKKIKISDINYYHYYAGDYTMYSDNDKLKIDSYAIDEESKNTLLKFLKAKKIPKN